jgi:hypothetical protein
VQHPSWADALPASEPTPSASLGLIVSSKGIGVIAIALGLFAVDTIQTPFVAIVVLGLLAIVLDAVGPQGGHHHPSEQPPGASPVPSAEG